jgi:hypothetical protein
MRLSLELLQYRQGRGFMSVNLMQTSGEWGTMWEGLLGDRKGSPWNRTVAHSLAFVK